MAGITGYVLQGGPCDGKTGELTPSIIQAGQLTCSGHIYKITSPVQVVSGREVFKDAGLVPKPPPNPTTAHTHHGWRSLQHSINVHMPAALRKAERYQAAALRSLSGGRKVR